MEENKNSIIELITHRYILNLFGILFCLKHAFFEQSKHIWCGITMYNGLKLVLVEIQSEGAFLFLNLFRFSFVYKHAFFEQTKQIWYMIAMYNGLKSFLNTHFSNAHTFSQILFYTNYMYSILYFVISVECTLY